MNTSLRRPPRWSRKTDELVRHVALGCRPGLQSELGQWLEESPRFRAFVTAHQEKVRKKLGSSDEQSRLDVRAELLIAYLVLRDRRFEVAFEAYGARRLGPDLSLTYRDNQRFNLEVTRLRATGQAGSARLADVVSGKLRQLPGEASNGLVITGHGLPLSEESLATAVRLLKTHSDGKDDAFFARRGLKSARDFYAQFLHLGTIFVLDEAPGSVHVVAFANREARHPLPRDAVAALTASLSVAHAPPV
jgi:hypothetical protein